MSPGGPCCQLQLTRLLPARGWGCRAFCLPAKHKGSCAEQELSIDFWCWFRSFFSLYFAIQPGESRVLCSRSCRCLAALALAGERLSCLQSPWPCGRAGWERALQGRAGDLAVGLCQGSWSLVICCLAASETQAGRANPLPNPTKDARSTAAGASTGPYPWIFTHLRWLLEPGANQCKDFPVWSKEQRLKLCSAGTALPGAAAGSACWRPKQQAGLWLCSPARPCLQGFLSALAQL